MAKKSNKPIKTATAVHVDTLEKLRELKAATGKTMTRILADAVNDLHRRELARN